MTQHQPDAPTVTIGLPVYNGERFLQEALDSILGQTFGDFELIVSDNASTDGTQAICERAAALDPRVRYERLPENVGAAPNYNRLLAGARGRYFKWAAHDDRCLPRFLERCVTALDDDPSLVLAYPSTSVIDDNGCELRIYRDGLGLGERRASARFAQYLDANFLGRRGMCNPIFGLIRTDALKRTRLIQDFIASDRSLLGHLALLGGFAELDDVLFERRIHLQTSTMANAAFEERRKWFNPAQSNARRRSRNNHLSLRMTHLADFWRATDELVPTPRERLSCRTAMLSRLAARPKWLWRDIKYSLGHAPRASDIMRTLTEPRTG